MTASERVFWEIALEGLRAVERILPRVTKALENWLSEGKNLKKPA